MLAKLSVDQALMKAKSYEKKYQIAEAKKLYQAVLLAFPKNIRAQKGLEALNNHNQNNTIENPPKEKITQLVNLYNQGQLQSVIEKAQALTKQYPKAFWVSLQVYKKKNLRKRDVQCSRQLDCSIEQINIEQIWPR